MEENKKIKKPTFKYANFMEYLESLGFTYFQVEEGTKKREESAGFIERLKNLDDCYSNTLLAIIYQCGVLVDKDENKMFYYLERAAKNKSPIGYVCLSLCYYSGYLVEKDVEKAQKYCDKYNRTAQSKYIILNDIGIYRYILEKSREVAKSKK